MKIGLIRHFKVLNRSRWFLNSDDFKNAMEEYDNADVIPFKVDLKSENWNICVSSTMPRAEKTAEFIFNGKIIFNNLFVEVPMSPVKFSSIKLPAIIWHIKARYAWYKNDSSQTETRKKTSKRIDAAIEFLNQFANENVLIVTHGFFMRQLYKRLLNEGFKGKIDEAPKNGKLYILTK